MISLSMSGVSLLLCLFTSVRSIRREPSILLSFERLDYVPDETVIWNSDLSDAIEPYAVMEVISDGGADPISLQAKGYRCRVALYVKGRHVPKAHAKDFQDRSIRIAIYGPGLLDEPSRLAQVMVETESGADKHPRKRFKAISVASVAHGEYPEANRHPIWRFLLMPCRFIYSRRLRYLFHHRDEASLCRNERKTMREGFSWLWLSSDPLQDSRRSTSLPPRVG